MGAKFPFLNHQGCHLTVPPLQQKETFIILIPTQIAEYYPLSTRFQQYPNVSCSNHMPKHNNYQLSQPSEKNQSLPHWSSCCLSQKLFFLFFACTCVSPVWFQLKMQPALIAHSCLLKVTSLCLYLFQPTDLVWKHLLFSWGMRIGWRSSWGLLLSLKICSSSFRNAVPDLEREHLLEKEGWSTTAVSTISGILDHRIILCLSSS